MLLHYLAKGEEETLQLHLFTQVLHYFFARLNQLLLDSFAVCDLQLIFTLL